MDDLNRLFEWCLNHWSFTMFCLAFFVQITPVIKFNPLTALFTWIGKIITADVSKEISEMKGEIGKIKEKLQSQEDSMDENEKDRIRFEVLNFAASCRNGQKHTKDEFEHIIDLNTKYGRLIAKTDDENGVFDAEYEYVYEIYQHCQRENNFL